MSPGVNHNENFIESAAMNWRELYKRPDFWLVAFLGGWMVLHGMKQLHISPENWTEQYWPLLFVAAGVYLLISTRYRDATSSLMLISLGIILFLIQIEILTPEFIQTKLPDLLLRTLRKLIDVTMYVL